MNILVVSPLNSVHHDAGWYWVKALIKLGHRVDTWDYRAYPEVKKSPIKYDLTIVFKGETLVPSMFSGKKVCYWPDKLDRTPGIENILKGYDKVFCPMRPTPKGMIWLPTGFDPDTHKDLKMIRGIDSVYIGTNNSEYKFSMVRDIKPTEIYGNNWQWYPELQVKLPVYDKALAVVCNRAKVIVDIHQAPDTGVNRKFFEMVACGLTIVDNVPGIQEILGTTAGYVTYLGAEDARSLIRSFVKDPIWREEVWRQEKQAILGHSYEEAAKKLLAEVR